jgi:hypothetical protein
MSITYGYISPQVSRRIVKYQDPDKPSYHRWDAGAAADFVLHEAYAYETDPETRVLHYVDQARNAPAVQAAHIAELVPFSRMITYSESPCICFGVNADEKKPRSALYENRYEGKPRVKPKFITHRKMPVPEETEREVARHGWVGAGHPTHHGGGRLQYHHIRLGRFLLLSDCLRAPNKIAEGEHNRPPRDPYEQGAFTEVAQALDAALHALYCVYGAQASIVATYGADYGYVDPAFRPFNRLSSWQKGRGGMILAVPDGDADIAVNSLMTCDRTVVEKVVASRESDYILVSSKEIE